MTLTTIMSVRNTHRYDTTLTTITVTSLELPVFLNLAKEQM